MKLFGAKKRPRIHYRRLLHAFPPVFSGVSNAFEAVSPSKNGSSSAAFLFAAVFASNAQSQEWRETHQLSASCCSDAGLLLCTTCRHWAGRPGQPFPMMNIMPRRMDFQSVFFRTDWKSILRASSRGTTIASPKRVHSWERKFLFAKPRRRREP